MSFLVLWELATGKPLQLWNVSSFTDMKKHRFFLITVVFPLKERERETGQNCCIFLMNFLLVGIKNYIYIIGVCIWNRCLFIKICLYLNNKLNEFNNQGIGHCYLWLSSIFLVTGRFLPNITARPLRLTIHRFNFWPLRNNWSAALKVRTASIEISSNQNELSLVNTAREVARPI